MIPQDLKEIFLEKYQELNNPTPKVNATFFLDILENPEKIKVLIIGQDPYPKPGIANGVAFAVPSDQPIQPSLRIILQELANHTGNLSLGLDGKFDTTLQHWIDQGIYLINSTPTCETNNIGSHVKIWKGFMTEYFNRLNHILLPGTVIVFLGGVAKEFSYYLDSDKFKILNYPHPAADLYGTKRFQGSGIFNAIEDNLKNTIKWY